jgi:hypothetical protein
VLAKLNALFFFDDYLYVYSKKRCIERKSV